MKNLLVDFNHMAFRTFFACRRDIEDVGWGYFKHSMLNSIFSFCNRFEPDQIIIASDSRQNWRRRVYPDYKLNRKEKRDQQDDVDWDSFFGTMDELLKEMKAYFPFIVLKIQLMEADDIIGAYVKLNQSEKSIIITSDSDYVQLLQYKNVQVFDPMKNKFMQTDDPLRALKVKVISGDNGDNVPNILKEKMKDPTIRKRMGEKTAESLIDDPEKFKQLFEDTTVLEEEYEDEDGETKKRPIILKEGDNDVQMTLGMRAKAGYKRNKILIDLNYVPEKLIKIMQQTIEDYEIADGKEIFQYCAKNKFREFVNRMDYIEKCITPAIEYAKQKEIFG